MMKSTILPGAIAFSFLLLFASAGPAAAQHVISNPGWCAQFYRNANCQNYGRGSEDIVTTGTIDIIAATGADAGGGPSHRLYRRRSVVHEAGLTRRLDDASGGLRRVAGNLRQGQGEGIDQSAPPGLRQHR